MQESFTCSYSTTVVVTKSEKAGISSPTIDTMCVNGLLPSENKIYNCCQIERVVISSMKWKREPVGLVLNVATMRRCDERSGHMKRTIRCPIIEYSTVPVKQFCSHPSFRAQAIQFQNLHSTVQYSNCLERLLHALQAHLHSHQ